MNDSTAEVYAIEELQNKPKSEVKQLKVVSCRITDSEIPEYRKRAKESRDLLLEKGLFSEYTAKRLADDRNLENEERVKRERARANHGVTKSYRLKQ